MSSIKLSTLLADGSLIWEHDAPAGEAIIGEARRLEAIEANANGHIATLTEDDAGPCLETMADWNGGVVWVGYIPAGREFIISNGHRGSATSLVHSAEKSSDRIRMKAIVEAYNESHGNKAVLWPLPVLSANPNA